MQRLTEKVAVITGGAGGIGAASVKKFVEEGATVVFGDVNQEAGEALAAHLGSKANFQLTDVSSESDIKNLIEFTAKQFGKIDCLFNNAGIGGSQAAIADLERDETYQKTIDVLFSAVASGMKYVTPIMREQGAGSIINTASVAATGGGFGPHLYSAMKAAVLNLSRSVAQELGPDNIRVNAICPGGVATNIFSPGFEGMNLNAEQVADAMRPMLAKAQPIGRSGEVEDIANMAAFLASDESTFISGQSIFVDGALTAGIGKGFYKPS